MHLLSTRHANKIKIGIDTNQMHLDNDKSSIITQ